MRVGAYESRSRPRSESAVRPIWLTDLIRQIHVTSRASTGRRVHAEPTLGHRVPVSHGSVELLCTARASWASEGARSYTPPGTISADEVKREVARPGPNQLWVTDINEHRTREGKVYWRSSTTMGGATLLPQPRALKSARAAAEGEESIDQPTIRREYVFRTAAQYRADEPV